ncbi:hypothetical protein IFM89_036886 [Coptis chinensis]|uniref:NTF2 domain-containing protein n=1 Tax=Coptis chinensis TaxID=261450 RepID=A0A835LY71_9MAGN|nr:hypothetical protein IFM89_036886 [Coptis chinensis]
MDPDSVAKAFVEHYYSTFDANRGGLANLYQETSMLSFEGQKIQGSQNIVAKLISLPFQQCQHSITTVDCQPSGPAGGMLVFVSGNLQLAGEQHALKFSQAVSSTVLAVIGVLALGLGILTNYVVESEALVIAAEIAAHVGTSYFSFTFDIESTVLSSTVLAVIGVLALGLGIVTICIAESEALVIAAEMFHLMPTTGGSFYVLNDIFRLNYA